MRMHISLPGLPNSVSMDVTAHHLLASTCMPPFQYEKPQ